MRDGSLSTCAGLDCDELFKPQGRKRFHHPNCKLRTHRDEVRRGKVALPHHRPPEPDFGARVLPVPITGPALFSYADPPYPGKAHLYPEGEEVDHEVLIHDLVEDYPDGWALSTSSEALGDVLALCPRGIRVGSWHRQHRPYLERSQSWEPVIFCGGRRTPECAPDSVTARVPADWDLPGRKPDPFYFWVFDFLGVKPGDVVDEPFPGSGAGSRALRHYFNR